MPAITTRQTRSSGFHFSSDQFTLRQHRPDHTYLQQREIPRLAWATSKITPNQTFAACVWPRDAVICLTAFRGFKDHTASSRGLIRHDFVTIVTDLTDSMALKLERLNEQMCWRPLVEEESKDLATGLLSRLRARSRDIFYSTTIADLAPNIEPSTRAEMSQLLDLTGNDRKYPTVFAYSNFHPRDVIVLQQEEAAQRCSLAFFNLAESASPLNGNYFTFNAEASLSVSVLTAELCQLLNRRDPVLHLHLYSPHGVISATNPRACRSIATSLRDLILLPEAREGRRKLFSRPGHFVFDFTMLNDGGDISVYPCDF